MTNNQIIELRHILHKYPEISNSEYKTSEMIDHFMRALLPDKVVSLSKTGKAFIFNGKESGKTLMFRTELDALSIKEDSSLEYRSVHKNVTHSCGHDGHMAIIAGLAQKISKNLPEKGKVVLLFQPAEELEQGAKDVVEDPEFIKIKPDIIFALHNIPGKETNKILLKTGTFAAASKGVTVKLFGKTSHAAEPKNGKSPAYAISRIIKNLKDLQENKTLFNNFTLNTVIHILLGNASFGTTPGYAEIMITLRTFKNSDMELLTQKVENIIKEISKDEQLKYKISYSEIFPNIENNDYCVDLIEQSAKESNLEVEYMKNPFKWSEDFGYYTQKYKGGYFGLGAGIHQPQLHNPDYDFPDEIIETGINIFYNIYKKINF